MTDRRVQAITRPDGLPCGACKREKEGRASSLLSICPILYGQSTPATAAFPTLYGQSNSPAPSMSYNLWTI